MTLSFSSGGRCGFGISDGSWGSSVARPNFHLLSRWLITSDESHPIAEAFAINRRYHRENKGSYFYLFASKYSGKDSIHKFPPPQRFGPLFVVAEVLYLK